MVHTVGFRLQRLKDLKKQRKRKYVKNGIEKLIKFTPCWSAPKNQLDELDFWSSSNFISTAYVACKIQVRCKQKLSSSNLIFGTQFFKNQVQINRGSVKLKQSMNVSSKLKQKRERSSSLSIQFRVFTNYLTNLFENGCWIWQARYRLPLAGE